MMQPRHNPLVGSRQAGRREVLAEAARWYANLAVIAAWYGDDDIANTAFRKVKLISPSLSKEIKPMLVRPPELKPSP